MGFTDISARLSKSMEDGFILEADVYSLVEIRIGPI